jgi:SAM-dependent methyltransferase
MNSQTTSTGTAEAEAVTESVREHYAAAAQRAASGKAADACGSPGTTFYAEGETAELPEQAVLASLGCGNPTALIDLHAGQVVLDLGSGGGIDVLLSARRVGPNGFAYGLDMTDEMLALARANQERAGASNVSFLKGRMEQISLPGNAVDVVISNCVINLAPDKGRVLREAYRVLKPGGRFAVADVVALGALPEALQRDRDTWSGCVSGALDVSTYMGLLADAGFEQVGIELTQQPRVPDGAGEGSGRVASAFVRAAKPLVATERLAVPLAASCGCGTGTDGCCCG